MKIKKHEWAAILVAAFLVTAPLAGGAIYEVWQHETEQQATGGQQYQRAQTIIAALSALSSFLTVGLLMFQAAIFGSQARISNRQRRLIKRQAVIMERQVGLEERRFAADYRPRLIMTEVWSNYTDESIQVFFTVINIGILPASIGLMNFRFAATLISTNSPKADKAETGHIAGGMEMLGQSDSRVYNYVFKDMVDPFAYRSEGDVLAFSGDVFYFPEGKSNPRYILGFCREIHGRNPTFYPSDNPAREYSY